MATDSLYTKETFLSLLGSTQACAGTIDIILPPVSGKGEKPIISGFLEDEFTLNMGNTWGSVLPDAKTANQIAQILNSQNIVTWISSSAAAWQSTQPIEFDIVVYLFTLVRNQTPSILDEAKEIMKMMALYTDNDDFATAKIHGGYHVDYSLSNSDLALFTNFKDISQASDEDKAKYSSQIASVASSIKGGEDGTIKVRINRELEIDNLLLTKASFTHSAAYINSITPLYVKMDLGFRSSRAPLVKDIEKMYRG